MILIRAEPHLTDSDGVDHKDWVSVNARESRPILADLLTVSFRRVILAGKGIKRQLIVP